jgi:FkbM family methyltransferase
MKILQHNDGSSKTIFSSPAIASLHRRILKRILRFKYLHSSFLDLNGVRFETPNMQGTMCWAKNDWMIDLLKRIAQKFSGTFLDVGVNLGQTLLAMKSVDPERKYVGVEPNPSCIAYVEGLIKQNGLRKTRLVPVGVGKEVCLKELYMNGGEYDSCATFIPNFRSGHPISQAKTVPVFPFSMLRSLFDGDSIGIVKIDVEGAELEVLESMQGVVDEMRPLVIVEILPVYDTQNSQRLDRQMLLEELVKNIDLTKLLT